MKKKIVLALGVCVLLQSGIALAAPVSALSFLAFGVSGNNAVTVGWGFTVVSPIEVTDLGYYDIGGDGLTASHDVAIWTSGGTPLLTATVPAGVGATLVDGFRYTPIAPSVLNPGDYIIGAYNPANTDGYVALAAGLTVDPRIIRRRGVFGDTGGSLGFVTGDPGSDPSVYGPGFRIDAVPEPSILLLLGASLAVAGYRRQRTPTNR